MARTKVLRPPGLLVFGLFVLAAGVLWWLYADTLVERGVEATGESLVGARVELDFADLRPTDGSIRLVGLQVANPDAPMRNLLEAEEIAVDLMVTPLLERKVIVENLVVSGVRFNTPRETSGALENPDPEAGRLWREVNGWAEQIEVPTLSMESLSGVVSTEALHADSLRTVRHARAMATRADSLRSDWEARLVALDPRQRIDSIADVVRRLEAFRPSPLNALQIPALVGDGREALQRAASLQAEVSSLDDSVREGLATLAVGPESIADLRDQDLAFALSLLNIPSLEAPTISPALFGGTALVWLKPVLFWARSAERFLPPGLDPRNRPGPSRARAEGTTVDFPAGATYPAFLVQRGEIDLEIGGTGVAAGSYAASLTGLTSSPSLLGQPMVISVDRAEGVQGPGGLTLRAVLDHTGEVLRDSAALALSGIGLPEVDLEQFGGRLSLGQGESTFTLLRSGDQIDARLRWSTDDVSWTRTTPEPSADAVVGSAEWARGLVWRTLAGVARVELSMGLQGDLDSPAVSITSNLGEAVAASLRREMGEQVAAAEARVRAEVDRHVQPTLDDARRRVADLRAEVADRVATHRQELEDLRARLDARVQALVGRAPL